MLYTTYNSLLPDIVKNYTDQSIKGISLVVLYSCRMSMGGRNIVLLSLTYLYTKKHSYSKILKNFVYVH